MAEYTPMTTTDTAALTEKIRDEVAGIVIGSGYYSTAIGVDEADEIAAAVLPIVEAEVRAAKAEAWDEGCEAFESAHKCDHIEPWGHLRDNPYRETGGSDEPR